MAKYPLTNKANKYAREVVSGKIDACLQVRQACQRHMDDLQKEKTANYPYKFDKEKCERFLKFAEMMPHIKGKWAGTRIVLEPWQCFCFGIPFGWVWKKDGLRRFREVFLLIPRKNAKSTLGAVVGNYMFSADREAGAEVYSAATSEAQAREVFRPAWLMTKKSPRYMDCFGVDLSGTEKNPGNIYGSRTDSRFETVIGKPGDGASPHCWIQDEYHEAKTDESYDTGKTGMGARSQPMMWVITTAGTNTGYPCYALQNRMEKILDGTIVNDEIFAVIYTIDKDDDWADFNVWKKANPNINVSVSERFLKSQLKTAVQDARKQNIMLCKHLNMWSNAAIAYFNMFEFDACADPTLDINDFEGEPVYVGLDLAAKKDLAALMMLFKREDDYILFSRYYLPRAETAGEDKALYAGWAHDGYITLHEGARINIESIQEDIKELAQRFDLTGEENQGGEVCNDPWNAQQLIANLEADGISCTEISQTVAMLSEPMKEIDALITEGRLIHDANPVTKWCFANTMATIDKKDNVFPFKEGPENKIDGAVATINAMCRAMVTEIENKFDVFFV